MHDEQAEGTVEPSHDSGGAGASGSSLSSFSFSFSSCRSSSTQQPAVFVKIFCANCVLVSYSLEP